MSVKDVIASKVRDEELLAKTWIVSNKTALITHLIALAVGTAIGGWLF